LDAEEPARVDHAGRRLKEQSVQNGERRHVSRDADQDAEDDRRSERRRPSKTANGIRDILPKCVSRRSQSDFAYERP
jgi:hypothetical protein